MKNAKLISIALIIIAVIAISIVAGFAVFINNNSSGTAYEIGRSAGKMASPYLLSLGIMALLLLIVRAVMKKF